MIPRSLDSIPGCQQWTSAPGSVKETHESRDLGALSQRSHRPPVLARLTMNSGLDPDRRHTFVIHVTTRGADELTGLIHNVRTGEKRRFERVADLGTAIESMVQDDASDKGAL